MDVVSWPRPSSQVFMVPQFLAGAAWAAAFFRPASLGPVECHCTCECEIPDCPTTTWSWEVVKFIISICLGLALQFYNFLGLLWKLARQGQTSQISCDPTPLSSRTDVAAPSPLSADSPAELEQRARDQVMAVRRRQAGRD